MGTIYYLEQFEEWPETVEDGDVFYFDVFSIPNIRLNTIKTQMFKDRFKSPCLANIYLPFVLYPGTTKFNADELHRVFDDPAYPVVMQFDDGFDEFEIKAPYLSYYMGLEWLDDHYSIGEKDVEQYMESFIETLFAAYSKHNYKYYLDSDYWQKLRKECFKRDDFRCVRCGSAKNLNAHHLNYEHLGKLGDLDNLITLCGKCHTEVHDQDIKNKRGGDK